MPVCVSVCLKLNQSPETFVYFRIKFYEHLSRISLLENSTEAPSLSVLSRVLSRFTYASCEKVKVIKSREGYFHGDHQRVQCIGSKNI